MSGVDPGTVVAALALLAWLYLMLFHGRFWRADQVLEPPGYSAEPDDWPEVAVVIPARNEAASIEDTVRALLDNGYGGDLSIILVDDSSDDGTAEIARRIEDPRLHVLAGKPLADGWSGKLWAVHQGLGAIPGGAGYVLLGDADIRHRPGTLSRLVAKAEREGLVMVTVMALLEARSFWERLLIPPFVFFFQKLYPFPSVNDPSSRVAAAAGGCMLIRSSALTAAGGVEPVRDRIIDDCAIGRAIKRQGAVWLGLSRDIVSTRRYTALSDTWDMVTRTAFEQLHYSALLLFGTIVGMALLYLVPPVALIAGSVTATPTVAALGGGAWLLMICMYMPTVRHFRLPPVLAVTLPLAAFLYSLMTLSSAWRHWRGRGATWKGRRYSKSDADDVTRAVD